MAAIHIVYHYDLPIDFGKLLKDRKLRDVVPFLVGLEGGKLTNSNSDKVVQLYSLLWIRGKITIDFKSILQCSVSFEGTFTVDSRFSSLMFEYQNEVLEFCADKNVVKLDFSNYIMTSYEFSAMLFMLKNLLRWSNGLFSVIYVNTGSYDERLLQVFPSCMKRCDSVFLHFFYGVWNYELVKVVPFLDNVAVHVNDDNCGVAVDYIGNAISNTSECKLQHLTVVVTGRIKGFPKDIINGILEFSHVLETVSILHILPHVMALGWLDIMPSDWINQSHVMMNDVNKRISDGLMGKLHHFVIDLSPCL